MKNPDFNDFEIDYVAGMQKSFVSAANIDQAFTPLVFVLCLRLFLGGGGGGEGGWAWGGISTEEQIL